MASSKRPRKNATPAPKKFWTPTRIGITSAALVILAAVASTFFIEGGETPSTVSAKNGKLTASNPTRRPGPLTEISPGTMQANFEMLDGQQIKLADYAGKVVVLDVWATWCGPCRVEIPHLIQLASEFKSKGVEVIGMTTEDKSTDEDAVREFVKAFKIDYPIGWANRDLAMEVLQGRGAIPQTLVIGRDGKLRKHLIGFNNQISPPQLRKAIEDAVAISE